MKLQFKYQKFQADAAKTICDIFAGQPYYTPTYLIDKGVLKALQVELNEDEEFVGVRN
jgi:type III restriction enzyme